MFLAMFFRKGIQPTEVGVAGWDQLRLGGVVADRSHQRRPALGQRHSDQTVEPSWRQHGVVIEQHQEPARGGAQSLVDAGWVAAVGFIADHLDPDRLRPGLGLRQQLRCRVSRTIVDEYQFVWQASAPAQTLQATASRLHFVEAEDDNRRQIVGLQRRSKPIFGGNDAGRGLRQKSALMAEAPMRFGVA